jgi:hypothetical protein
MISNNRLKKLCFCQINPKEFVLPCQWKKTHPLILGSNRVWLRPEACIKECGERSGLSHIKYQPRRAAYEKEVSIGVHHRTDLDPAHIVNIPLGINGAQNGSRLVRDFSAGIHFSNEHFAHVVNVPLIVHRSNHRPVRVCNFAIAPC